MKENRLDILVESIQYLLISYILSSLSFSFQSSPLYILIFAADIWFTCRYLKTLAELVEKKRNAWLIFLAVIVILAIIVWRFGFIAGKIIRPWI